MAWLLQYKSVALFVLLALGIVGLPIPDETLLTFAGALVAKGHLNGYSVIFSAYMGSILGVSLSYLIGRTAGSYLVKKYGYRFGLTKERIDKVHLWFEKIGKWTLFVGYFIPGVRHLTGYVAGTTELCFFQFGLFAYLGALLWSSLFLALGYFSGQHWERLLSFLIDNVENLILLISMVMIIGFAISLFYDNKKNKN